MLRSISLGMLCTALMGQAIEFSGQFTGVLSGGNDPATTTVRYLPQMDVTLNAFRLQVVPNLLFTTAKSAPEEIRPYRLWGRYVQPQFQITAGLQKLNFGPAKLLRPLQWFDQLDPRDPTMATRGVWGISTIYSTFQGQEFRGWVLYGNDEPKGLEILPGNSRLPEWGGRVEQSLGPVEAGVTWHSRGLESINEQRPRERRLAIDGYWEPGPALWLESSYSDYTSLPADLLSTSFTTIGADYSWSLGQGLYTCVERMYVTKQSATENTTLSLTAMILRYPLSWLDTISLLGFFSPRNEVSVQYISWQRTLDDWDILAGLFFSTKPDANLISTGETVATGVSGIQVLFTYHY
ncbi:MAG: hypothetical protein ACE5D8_09920 [Fidelibacterota bacterium]